MNFYNHLITNLLNYKTMKKNYLLLASAALMAAASCTQISPDGTGLPSEPSDAGMGTLVVNVRTDAPSTKVLSEYKEEKTYEKAVNKVEIFVFDAGTKDLNGYFNVGTEKTASMNVTAGNKNVYAVVNGPAGLSAIADEDTFKAFPISLEDNSTDVEKGFVMAGMKDIEVTAGGVASPTIEVSRLTSRIALVKVTNNLPPAYGDFVIEDVFITNVVANQNLVGTANASVWYNIKGRDGDATQKDHIIGLSSYVGTCQELTHIVPENLSVPNALNENQEENHVSPNCLFYAYPNDSEAAGDEVSWDADPFPGDKTRLVLTATVDGTYYYYPVVIDRLERNKSYDVSVKISGFGVDDPDAEVAKGAISFTVEPKGWDMGDAIDKDL